MMAARLVRRIRDAKMETPAAANQLVKALRALFSWANEAEETTVDPTIGVKKLKYASAGHHSWTADEIEQYYERHPTAHKRGSRWIFCATLRGDARTHYGWVLNIFATVAFVSVRPRMSIAIRSRLTFPCIPRSQPALRQRGLAIWHSQSPNTVSRFTANGFGNKFKEWCRQADLPNCSAHGVSKATAAALAEARATRHQIMVITGHQTLEEVERYIALNACVICIPKIKARQLAE
jgi:integrase/recombinase XerD